MRAAERPSSTEPRSSVLSGLAICPIPFAHFAGGCASAYLRHVCGGSGSVSSAKGGVEWRGVVCVGANWKNTASQAHPTENALALGKNYSPFKTLGNNYSPFRAHLEPII